MTPGQWAVLAAILLLLAAGFVVPQMGQSIPEINQDLKDSGMEDTTCSCLLVVFPLAIGVVGVLGLVGIVVTAVKLRQTDDQVDP